MPDTAICQKIVASSDSTVAVEALQTRPFRKRKLILFFESFRGEFFQSPDAPGTTRLDLQIEASSVVCREKSFSAAKRVEVARQVREAMLAASQYPQIVFRSTIVTAKPLRGFVMHGDLTIRGITHTAKANLGVSEMSHNRLQIDADAQIRLSDFGIHPPSSLFGLVRVSEDAMAHLMLWTNTAGLLPSV